jgi:alpha-amylase
MARRISLALVLHNHQPVGNFGWVMEEVFGQAYEPMVGALERHPQVRVGLHYTGPLIEWIAANRPGFIKRLRALVRRGQVEMLGGAQYEPILVVLPERDRQGQLRLMREDVRRRFGRAPAGAWLAERVWEPSLAADLAAAGYRYTVLDDNHLRGASVPEDEMWGTYTTDDQGRLLTIFGTEKGLRYLIPFRPVDELIRYLRDHATEDGRLLGTMGDDGEKFGAWPGTYEHCWGSGDWIEKCFTALAHNANWLTTVTPSEWLEREPPRGRIYVPTASYVEMTEWALPPAEANQFHRLLEKAVAARSPAARFLRGGMWRSFQARYREINDLHKQMLRASAAVDAMPEGADRKRALDHLYRGQSNDCYWHGLFGGIYIVHMRMATLHHLIAAEDLALGGRSASGVADYDLDGVDEALIGTVGQTVLVDITEGGGIGAWDLRAPRLALASALRRRPEAYHEQLRAFEAARAKGEKVEGKTATSIHDQLLTKEEGLSRLLVYDDHERRSGLVRVFGGRREVGDFATGEWQLESSGKAELVLTRSAAGITVGKRVVLGGGRLDPTLRLEVGVEVDDGGKALDGELAVEWNINLMGGGGNPDAYYRWAREETRHDIRGEVPPQVKALEFGNRYEGVAITARSKPSARRDWWPVETVSNSEAGFERVYQASCLTFRWPLQVRPGAARQFVMEFVVDQERDHRAAS